MKILLIANSCQWASWPQKIAAIKAFYAPLVELDIDIKYTDYQNIPTASYPGVVTTFANGVATDTQGTDLEIDQTWFNENIGPLIAGYEIAIFQAANVSADGLPLGVKFEELSGTWCCETFVTDETFTYSLPELPGQTAGTNLGNEAEVIIEHEISHALYAISGQTDNTHKFFYANQFSRVLTDIVLPSTSSPLIALYQKVIADLEEELGLIKQNQSTADMDTSTTKAAKEASTTFPPMIEKWITAISQWEGAKPELHNPGNLKLSTLTASWGGTRGPAASDGGYLCQFATDNAGEIALGNFLTLGCEDELIAFHQARTLQLFSEVYAGNPPQTYIEGIANILGVPLDTNIASFLT